MLRAASRLRRHLAALAALLLTAAVPPADSPVADAAMRGDAVAVRALLRDGADVNAAQGDGMTALHWAAQHGDAPLTRMLLYAGAKVDVATRNGNYTPLHLAARTGSGDIVETLLGAGANAAAATSSGGATALHFAAGQGNADIVERLLAAGVEPDVRDRAFELTPLMWAAAAGRTEAMAVLLRHGADIAAKSRIEDIPERERDDRTSQQRRTKLMAALQEARAPREERAATRDSAATAADSTAAEPADTAAAAPDSAAAVPAEGTPPPADSLRLADSLREVTADSLKRAQAESAAAPRDSSAAAPDPAPAKEEEPEPTPLTYGELVGNKGGLTPLLFAARQGRTAAVVALLDAGADLDEASLGDGTTPLLIATLNGHFDLAMLLLERGADPNIASAAGAAPLYAAINLQWAPKALYPQPTAQTQQRTTYLELMQALIDAGADVNVRLEKHLWYMSYNFDLLDVNTLGATPFWRAAYATDVEAMRLLMAHGADPNVPTLRPPERRRRRSDSNRERGDAPDTDPSGLPPVPVFGPGVWPIHAAAGVGYGEGYAANAHRHVPDGWMPALRYLVEEIGADVNARDHNGYTPLHHAAARGDNEMILYLVEKGADVMAVSRRGQTTADMANGPVQRVQPFPETVALLEKLGSKNNHKCMSC